MSDEELDKIFKSAAEDSSGDHDLSNWKDMASKLDHAERSVWYKKRIVPIILFSVLIVGSLTFWFANDLTLNRNNPQSIGENKTSIDPNKPKERDTKIQNSTQILDQEKIGEMPRKDLSFVKKKVVVNEVSTKISNHQDQSNPKSTPSSSISIAGNNGAIQELVVQNSTRIVNQVEMDSIPMVKVEEVKNAVLTDSLSAENPEKNNPERKRGFSIKASIAPDFSSTELFKHGKPGFDIGITGGYHISERWSVYTGVILAKKIYTSSNVDESYTSNGNSYEIDQLDGDCKILDIPLNVYFSFNQNRSLSFKAGLGFSSYIMLSEDYTYFVNKPYGSTEYYQRVEHENNEWFKMMNLSFVVQKRLNNQFYLEFEPFIKVPTGGIGEGDIALYTVGGFLSLRYDFYKHKR